MVFSTFGNSTPMAKTEIAMITLVTSKVISSVISSCPPAQPLGSKMPETYGPWYQLDDFGPTRVNAHHYNSYDRRDRRFSNVELLLDHYESVLKAVTLLTKREHSEDDDESAEHSVRQVRHRDLERSERRHFGGCSAEL